MKNLLQKIKHEFLQVLPPTIFFIFAFNIVAITTVLMLRGRGIEATSILSATVLALITGKVILVADYLPFINKFPDRPLIYNIAWKTFIYVLAVALARYLEHFIPLLVKGKGVAAANHEILGEFVWQRFLAVQVWFVVLFHFYSVLVELVRALGKERVLKMFFGFDKSAKNPDI
jgi:hypothetical protein